MTFHQQQRKHFFNKKCIYESFIKTLLRINYTIQGQGRWYMQDELVDKLASFGFTVNQAKVYLSIVQSRGTHVGKISKETQLHRQDIYKLLPKLEQMGLITKTIDKPFTIEALPVQKALENIILKEKQQVCQRIYTLEKNLSEVVQAVQQPEVHDEACFTLLTTGEAMRNRSNQTFKKKRKNFNIALSCENLYSPAGSHYCLFFQQIVDTGAKIRLLIVGDRMPEELNQIIEKSGPKNGFFKVKAIEKSAFKDYQVVDNHEVWIGTQQKTHTGFPNILWTNDPGIVEAYSENFAETWNSPKSIIVHQNKGQISQQRKDVSLKLLSA